MEKIISGVAKFQQNVVGTRREFFENFATGQSPRVLFITCSDSRIDPHLITSCEPGELFIVRNAGNLVSAEDSAAVSGEVAAIEYAVSALGIKQVIVCGHSHCGAMTALLAEEPPASLPSVAAWLEQARPTADAVRAENAGLASNELLVALIEENVKAQLHRLSTLSSVKAATKAKKVELFGWVYRVESGEVRQYVPEENQFVALGGLANRRDP